MSEREFQEWRLIYDKLDPFGEYRADLRTGTMMAPLLNFLKTAYSGKTGPDQMLGQEKKPWHTIRDWIQDFTKPVVDEVKRPVPWQHMRTLFSTIAKSFERKASPRPKVLPLKRERKK